MGRSNKKYILKKKIEYLNKEKLTNHKKNKKVPSNAGKLSKRDQRSVSRTGNNNSSHTRAGQLLYSNELDDVNPKSYNKKSNVDYDVIIITGSYERYDMVENQIKQFFHQESKYSFKYVLLNDGSKDKRYDSLSKKYPDILYIKNEEPNGKFKYWQTITSLLQECGKYSAHAILQIDDDFYLCENFLNKVIDLFFQKKQEDNRYMCISYHLYNENHINEYRWGCANGSWVDGGGLYDYSFFEKTGFKLNEIPMSRWNRGVNLSTGVWEQISRSIKHNNCFIYKAPVSYVKHEGLIWGALERLDKKDNNKAITYKFIDDE